MPMKRDCAKSVRESNNDLTMLKSWISAIIMSVAWSIAPLLASSCLLHVRADGEEGDGDVVEGLVECVSRVSDGESGELHPFPVFSEGRDEGGGIFMSFSRSYCHSRSLYKSRSLPR